MGIYLRLANEIYLAISLLPLFLSGQLNAQLSWASREVPVAISHSPTFWIFQQQQDGRGMKPSCAPPLLLLGWQVLFCSLLFCFRFWLPWQLNALRHFEKKKKHLIFHWLNLEIILWSSSKRICHFLLSPDSLSHWIWELDQIKFLGSINFWGGQILHPPSRVRASQLSA